MRWLPLKASWSRRCLPPGSRCSTPTTPPCPQWPGVLRRSWAVLGPLGELGGAAAQAYREIGALAADLSVDRLVAVGEQARPLQVAAAGSAPVWVPDVPAALELLASELATGDVVLIKASRAAGLERLAEGLLGLE